ncbi:MAG: AbrB/MazE/SpoVT family DNA-binding domain-containing protein [Bryobacteraceae bacterium]|jgi:bifunctional DNA-binding transcriptional regulator/antitoxin component of YhaV-PrlF toxin-antitoxin module
MAVITVKDKNAVLIPASVIRKARIKVGDRLDANVESGKITLTPKSAVERGIEQGVDDLKRGRFYGPYVSAASAKKAFDDRTRALKRRERAAP